MYNSNFTQHYTNDRNKRKYFIDNVIGRGKPLETFYWDRGHRDGPEIHQITTTGIEEVYNAWTNKHITDLIARPQQIDRLYKMEGRSAPAWLLKKAEEHQKLGYNNL